MWKTIPESGGTVMAKKGGLGKGLDALFIDNAVNIVSEENPSELLIADIEPDRDQPRKIFDDNALEELANSIRQHGVLQPILVRPVPSGGYRIVAGERRWRASRLAGKTTIPAVVRNFSDLEAMTIALIENLQREDLDPIEEAQGYQKLMDASGYTQEEISKSVGRSRPAVSNALRLLSLPDEVQTYIRNGSISTGHAKAILSLPDDESRISMAEKVVADGLTVRETEKLCSKTPSQTGLKLPKQQDSFVREVELSLQEALGVEVKIKYIAGKGSLTVNYYSKDQLIDLANKLGK